MLKCPIDEAEELVKAAKGELARVETDMMTLRKGLDGVGRQAILLRAKIVRMERELQELRRVRSG